MRKFLRMLLAVLFCTSALCVYDVYAYSTTSSNASGSMNESIQNSISNIKSTALNTENAAYSDEEVYLTAQLMHHEAHNQSYNGKVAIAEVVLNRVESSLFPNKVNDVIFQSGQFTSSRRLKNINPTELELRIAYNVLNGSLRVLNDKDVMYFRNPQITSGISASTEKDWGNLEYATYIGEHAFYSQEVPKETKKESIFDKLPSSLNITKLFTHKTKALAAKNEAMSEATSEALSEVTSEETAEENAIEASVIKPPVNDNTESKLTDTTLVTETTATNLVGTLAVSNDSLALLNITEPEADSLSAAINSDAAVAGNIDIITNNTGVLLNTESALLNVTATDSTATNTENDSEADTVNLEDNIDESNDGVLENSTEIQTNAETVDQTVDPLDKEIEEFLKTYDENDPVLVARYQALLDQKAERDRIAKLHEEERLANENARQQAILLDKMAVEKVQRENEEYIRATNAAITQVLLMQGQ